MQTTNTASEPQAAPMHPEGKYAKVEMMGHRVLWGRISDQLVAGHPMLKVEPIINGAIVGETMVNAGSLYALTPCTAEQAFRHAPKTTYDETLRLLAAPAASAYDEIEATSREYNSEHHDHPDYDDEDEDVAIARSGRDPDQAADACEICDEAIVNGVGCGRTDCPYPTPKDPNTPDMFSIPGAPAAKRVSVNVWRSLAQESMPLGAEFQLKRDGQVYSHLMQLEDGQLKQRDPNPALMARPFEWHPRLSDEWRYEIAGGHDDLVQPPGFGIGIEADSEPRLQLARVSIERLGEPEGSALRVVWENELMVPPPPSLQMTVGSPRSDGNRHVTLCNAAGVEIWSGYSMEDEGRLQLRIDRALPPIPIDTRVTVKGDYAAKMPDLTGWIKRGPHTDPEGREMYDVLVELDPENQDTEMQLVERSCMRVPAKATGSLQDAESPLSDPGRWQFWSHEQPRKREQGNTTETVQLRHKGSECPGFIFWSGVDWLAAGGAADWLLAHGAKIAEDTVSIVQPLPGDIEWRIEVLG